MAVGGRSRAPRALVLALFNGDDGQGYLSVSLSGRAIAR